MNQAIRTFHPNSSWISAALLTLLVVSFGLFAEGHSQGEHMDPAVLPSFCVTDNSVTQTLFRYH